MHIVVCINRIPDPEAPAKQFRVDEQANRPIFERVNQVIGPFDENALEVALQLRDKAGASVTALTVGPASNEEALRRALGVGCTAAVHVKEEQAGELDSTAVARLLAAAVRRLAAVDLVLCGRQVGDWDSGQVGPLVAEELQWPCVTFVRQIEIADGGAVRLAKEITGGVATVEATTPAVVTITNTATNQLRIGKIKDVLAARRIQITALTAAELGADNAAVLAANPRVKVSRLFIPESNVQVEMIEGEKAEEIADKLARRILGLKVI